MDAHDQETITTGEPYDTRPPRKTAKIEMRQSQQSIVPYKVTHDQSTSSPEDNTLCYCIIPR